MISDFEKFTKDFYNKADVAIEIILICFKYSFIITDH